MPTSANSITVFLLRAMLRVLRAGLQIVNSGLRRLAPKENKASEPIVDESRVAQIERFLLSLDQPDERSAAYIRVHAGRLAITAALLPSSKRSGRVLELGSYMHLAPALQKFADYRQVQPASFGLAGTKVFKTAAIQGRELLACDLDLFDAEHDTFPYPNEHFELVLACELLEHLRSDPMHMFFEIHRVLAEDGWLMLSTPNCASIGSLEQCLWRSSNPYTYSLYPMPETRGDDPGSHTREYTPDELRRVFECAGFEVVFLITRPGRSVKSKDLIEDLLEAYGFPLDLRGEQMYCLGRKMSGGNQVRFPDFLYG